MSDDEQPDGEDMRFIGEDPIAKAYDITVDGDGELIAKLYSEEAAAEMEDAWWVRVESVNGDEQQ